MPPPVLGIDFGTTNTVVAVVLEDGSAEVLCNDIGSRLTPSVVYIDPSDPTKHQVGEAALRLGVGDPQNTIRNVKRILGLPPEAARRVKDLGPVKFGTSDHGDGVVLMLNDGSKITPEEVVAMQLVEVKKAAKRQLDQEVSKAVITVPSYYTAAQRRAIRDAAYLADLEVVELVNETTAAAAAYAHEREDSKTALIVDVGGGGCCISVVRVVHDEVTVLATSMRQPGGIKIDTLMLEYLKKAIKEQHGKDVKDQRTDEILRAQWAMAKIKLSRVPKATIQTFLPEIKAEFCLILTRDVFEAECKDQFKTIVESINETLKKAEVEVNVLEDVILVGGCTRILKLRELIKAAVGPKVHKALSADEVVAQGAALLGSKSVKIKQEILGLYTNAQVLSSEKQDYPEKAWPNGTLLPFSFSFDHLKIKDNTDIMVKQGHHKKNTIIVCTLPAALFQKFTIDQQGSFCFGTGSQKVPVSRYLKGCIPEAHLKTLKQKLQDQEKSSLLEADRVQAKNALEDVLRKGKSMVTSDEDLFPEEHSKFREKCSEKLNWLDEHASAGIETYNEIRIAIEQNREYLQEKCKKERERQTERNSLKDILDKAVDVEVFDDDFKERTRILKDDWEKEKAWLAGNSEASVEEYRYKKQCVFREMKKLKDDCLKAEIVKRTNALRESLQNKIQEIQKLADERLNGDDLERNCGNNLSLICKSARLWLMRIPRHSEMELQQRIAKLEEDRISTEETFENLKKQEEIKRIDAAKTAERRILEGLNIKVEDFEIVRDAALMFVETCNNHLTWLQNNPDRNATEYSEVTNKIELNFQNLTALHQAENNRLQTKVRLQQSLQNACKQTEEPFSLFFKNCLVWLGKHPTAEEELLKSSLSLVEGALDKLKKYSQHTNNAKAAKGLALEKTQSLSQMLGLQFNDRAAPAEIRREDNGYKPADYEEQLPSTHGDRNGLINHANGSPSVVAPYHPTLSEDAEKLAVNALSGAGEAGCMALLLSKVMFCGREFVSLAVRYVEESGQPVERPLFVKEPIGFGEDPESVKELFLEPFLALCKKAHIDWNKNLLGISHAGFGVQSEVLAKFLAGMRCDVVEDLDCGAVRLDERFVQKILREAGCSRFYSHFNHFNSLRDFFLSIDSLRRLFCTGGKWCKVLEDKCCSLCAGTNPWYTYTSTISFVSVEQKGLLLALFAVAQKDPDLRIPVQAIQRKMEDTKFKICLETCKELFKMIPGFDDNLALSNSNSIRDLKESLLKAFKYPERSLEPSFNFSFYSDKVKANELFEMCEDLMKPVLEEWKKSWDVLLSLLTAICDVLPEGNGKETPARCTRSQGKLAKDLQNFKSLFPERLTSLPAMLCGLPRKRFAKEYPDLHNSLMRALTAPLLPPQGPRAQEQLRACALHAITSPRLIDWPLPAETHP